MIVRHHLLFAVFPVACGVAAGSLTLAAQAPAHDPAPSVTQQRALARTPDGHPDFQGVWANNTVTPLQRPKQWEGKERLTDAEIADLQTFAAQILANDRHAQFPAPPILPVLARQTHPTHSPP